MNPSLLPEKRWQRVDQNSFEHQAHGISDPESLGICTQNSTLHFEAIDGHVFPGPIVQTPAGDQAGNALMTS